MTTVAGFECTEDYLIKMAAKVISGQVQCWACYEEEEEEAMRLGAFIFTSIIKDALTEQKNLLLSGVFVFNMKGIKVWKQGFERLVIFGRGSGCQNIVFYSNVPDILKIAKAFGASSEFTYGMIAIPK